MNARHGATLAPVKLFTAIGASLIFGATSGASARAEQSGLPPSPDSPPMVIAQAVTPLTAAPTPQPAAAAATAPASEEAVAHALERTLVVQGAALVPFRQFEIQPEFDYSLQSSNASQVVTIGGASTLVQSVRRDTISPSLTLRAGLPFEAQLEVFAPYVYDRERVVPAGTNTEVSRDSSGIGDVSVALSKQLLHERGAIPDLVGTVRYKTATGSGNLRTSFNTLNVSAGTGFESVEGQLTATKRSDPLVFLLSGAYFHNFSATTAGVKIAPGDIAEGKLGTILAVSPNAALSTDVDLFYASATKFNGIKAAGSDQVVGFLDIGGSVVVARNTVISVVAGVGVTQSSPSFRFVFAVPIRF